MPTSPVRYLLRRRPHPSVPPLTLPAPAPVVTPPPVEDDEVPLKAVVQAPPVIPRNVLASTRAGQVVVRFTVAANGSVTDPEVLSSTRRALNRPTLAAIAAWRFEPIKVTRPAQVEFDFAL